MILLNSRVFFGRRLLNLAARNFFPSGAAMSINDNYIQSFSTLSEQKTGMIDSIEARKRKLYTKNQLILMIQDGQTILFQDKRKSTASKTINRGWKSGWKCERCNMNQAVLTHHINQNYMDNRPNNLLRLCTPCHKTIHRILPKGIHLYKLTVWRYRKLF